MAQKAWLSLDRGIEIIDFEYQAQDWELLRRIVAVRQKVEDRPKATGKQLSLFEEDAIIGQYRYSVYITNLELSARLVWDAYRGRADTENRIKEIKQDFGLESFSTQNFFALEVTLNFVMIAYNLISLFRQAVMRANPQPQLKTLRYKLFARGAYITKNGNQRILNIAVNMKNQVWWDGLFARYHDIVFPYKI